MRIVVDREHHGAMSFRHGCLQCRAGLASPMVPGEPSSCALT